MTQFSKRVRASDKYLIFRFTVLSLLPIFLLVVGLFHIKTIQQINWQNFNLSQVDKIDIPYLAISLSIALFVYFLVVFLFQRYKYDSFKQLQHRQKLSKMILENRWYESAQVKTEGFFKDSSSRTKEKITYFPKMHYRLKNGLIQIRVEITLGKYQDQLLHLEKKLESGLYCELTDKELMDSYVEYTLLYDTISSRISIDEVQTNNRKVRLMENVWWEYDKLPHMLIAGGTGDGKTYFILTLIETLLHTDSKLYVLDPKNADLADLDFVMENVYYKKENMLSCIDNFYEEMMKRSEEMKQMENYKTGENYVYLELPSNFLIFDEYVAFMEMLGTKENVAVLNKLKQIVMLGRQAGFISILACQRPNAKYLGDGIRDQFNLRVALGRMSEMGYGMMFGSDVQKDFFLKQIKGRGCRQFESYLLAQKRSWYEFFMDTLVAGGVIKRLDLAINDKTGILNIPNLTEKCQQEECISVFRSFKSYRSGELVRKDEKECMGNTLYIGLLQSGVYFCLYKKDYEQFKKNNIPIEDADVKNRFEIRLKNERAYYAITDLLVYGNPERTTFKIINRYIRFVDKDDTKPRSDWKLNEEWAWFIGSNREQLKLTTKPEPYSFQRTLNWLSHQVAPTLIITMKLDEINQTKIIKDILDNAKLTERHEMILIQQSVKDKDVIT